MTSYFTAGEFNRETDVCRSRFIAHTFHVEGEDEAAAVIENLKKSYPDASHVCYAYVADVCGRVSRCDDDGEPRGTAGMPILSALKESGLKLTLVAVVRYFGGVMLGAGRLARTYGTAATEALRFAPRKEFVSSGVYTVNADYAAMRPLEAALRKVRHKVISREFAADAALTIAFPADTDAMGLIVSAVNGRCAVKFINDAYVAYDGAGAKINQEI